MTHILEETFVVIQLNCPDFIKSVPFISPS